MRKALTLLAAIAVSTFALAQAPTASGEVTKVDKANERITLKHGEIKSLNMPPMTMAYRVRPPQLLEGLAVGDRVRFTAERIDGNYTVTALSKAPWTRVVAGVTKYYLSLLVRRARMQGMVVFDYADRYPQAIAELSGCLKDVQRIA